MGFSKYSIVKIIKTKFGLDSKISKEIIWLVLLTISLISFVLFMIFSAIYKKLDSNAQYLITAKTEYISYTTSIHNSPSIILKNFYPSMDCDGYSDTLISEGILTVTKGFKIQLTRFGEKELTVTILKTIKNNDPADNKKAVSTLELEEKDIDFEHCFSAKIILDESNPVFSMNAIGNVQLGKEITDASDKYFPMLLEGEIIVTDYTVLSKAPYQFTPFVISQSDYIFAKNYKEPQRGIFRAIYGEYGINGVVSLHGGELFVQRYRSEAQKIERSFINLISSDYELAWSLSLALVIIQILFGVINFLLRLKLLDN